MVKKHDFAAAKTLLLENIAAQGLETATYLGAGGIDPAVIAALAAVPREEFVPEASKAHAYDNRPLPIGHDQTISQPYIVAAMTHLLRIGPDAKLLEIGTGCGYQTAVLAQLAANIITVERIPELADAARARLAGLGVENVTVVHGNGWQGWPDAAPYDGIIVTAAAAELPQALVDQLKPGARLVIPIGGHRRSQKLMVFEKSQDGELTESCGLPVAFVPLVAE